MTMLASALGVVVVSVVSGLLMYTRFMKPLPSSLPPVAYVPGSTQIVSPSFAASTAACIVV